MRYVIGFFHRLAYAVALGFVSFTLAAVPLGIDSDTEQVASFVVGLPLALAWRLLPLNWRGIDVISRGSFGEWLNFREALFYHLRAAVPTYLVLFYLPNAVAMVWRAMRRRVRTKTVPSA